MRVIIAGSRPPKAIRDNAEKLEQWYEEHYDMLDETVTKSGMRELIEIVAGGFEGEGWDELGKRWAGMQGLDWQKETQIIVTDGLVAMWDGESAPTRRLIAECEKAGVELECIWVEVVEA